MHGNLDDSAKASALFAQMFPTSARGQKDGNMPPYAAVFDNARARFVKHALCHPKVRRECKDFLCDLRQPEQTDIVKRRTIVERTIKAISKWIADA